MASKRFAVLVDAIARGFGQEGRQLKETPEAIYLRTPDGLVYAFFEDVGRLTPALVKGLSATMKGDLSRLVVLALQPLPLESAASLEEASASVVAGERFHKLLEGLELSGYVSTHEAEGAGNSALRSGDDEDEGGRRVLPTAQRLDETMDRARLWMSWGVPAIALRFFDEACRLKPEFGPAVLGRGTALIGLQAADSAEECFEEVLGRSPGDLDARIGLARVTGMRGDAEGEVEELRSMLKEDPSRLQVRAHLVAALAPMGKWREVRGHLEEFVRMAPQDALLHAALSVALERLGSKEESVREKRAADALGMNPVLWKKLREDLEGSTGSGARRASSSRESPPSPRTAKERGR